MKASKCKCCICGKQAVAFWPVGDPDIASAGLLAGFLGEKFYEFWEIVTK